MAKETGKQAGLSATSGAATGAAVGSTIMPGWGTAIGAIVGGVAGAVAGVFRGSSKRKAKKYARLAAQVQKERQDNADYNTFLQLIRQQRLARAATMSQAVAAGSEMSSKTAGAISGQQSQTAYGINYLANDRRLQDLYASYTKRAAKAETVYQDQTAIWNTLLGVGMAYASANAGKGTGGTTTTADTTQATQTASQWGVEGTFSMNPVINY